MSFLKGDTSKTYDVVVFVGNGAIENGSAPLRRAIDKLILNDPPLIKKVRSSNKESFHQLAILSYKFRLFKTYLYSKLFKDPTKCVESEILNELLQNKIFEGFLNLRKDIANEFCNTNNLSLKIDSEIQNIIGPESIYLTTNWDNILWQNSNVKNLIHMHGRCTNHESIVFPTELLVEEILYDIRECDPEVCKFKIELIETISGIFRCQALPELMSAAVDSEKIMLNAKKLVIWGYSLADYDADINARIGTWKVTENSELVVINPDLTVLSRAIALTGCHNAKLYDPLTKLVHRLGDL